jgi:hypothetical protein
MVKTSRNKALTPSLVFHLSRYFKCTKRPAWVHPGQQRLYARALPGRNAFTFTFNRALGKVNGLTAPTAGVGSIKFIREYLFFFSALATFADDYFEILEIRIPGTMLGSCNVISHNFLLIVSYL